MAITTMVAVLQVEPIGPDNMIGTGSLITATGVLVHPPLSYGLGSDDGVGPLRVCVASWGSADPVVQIIDVVDVRRSSPQWINEAGAFTAERHPIIELVLGEAATASTVRGDFRHVAGVIMHLADPFNGPITDGPTLADANRLCTIFGMFC
jgi:hypothetical protein